MRMIPVLKPCISNDSIQADTLVMVPEDEITARSILVSTKYLLRMEELVQTEKDEKKLKSLRYDIPRQKDHILDLWKKIEDPSLVQTLTSEQDKGVAEGVGVRLLAELEKNGPFFDPEEKQAEEEVDEEPDERRLSGKAWFD